MLDFRMKRRNCYDTSAKHKAKRPKYVDGAAKTTLTEPILDPFIPVDVIKHHIIPFGALDWLLISKAIHQVAMHHIVDDERVIARQDAMLKEAVTRQHFKLVERLLEDDRYTSEHTLEEAINTIIIDSDDDGGYKEVGEEDKRLIKLLLSHKLFATIWPNNILRTAVKKGWIDIVQHILATSKHTFENWHGIAIYCSAPVETLKLIRQDPRFYTKNGKTAEQLYTAISLGNLGAAILILEDERTNFESAVRILSRFREGVKILLADPRLVQSTYYQNIMCETIAEFDELR